MLALPQGAPDEIKVGHAVEPGTAGVAELCAARQLVLSSDYAGGGTSCVPVALANPSRGLRVHGGHRHQSDIPSRVGQEPKQGPEQTRPDLSSIHIRHFALAGPPAALELGNKPDSAVKVTLNISWPTNTLRNTTDFKA